MVDTVAAHTLLSPGDLGTEPAPRRTERRRANREQVAGTDARWHMDPRRINNVDVTLKSLLYKFPTPVMESNSGTFLQLCSES